MQDIARDNLRTYASPLVVGSYRRARGLQAPERVILDGLRSELEGAAILDLGVGAGRTTPHLLAISPRYVGLDFSAPMIAQARERFPGVDLRVGDARDLSAFDDGSFGLVMFSYNGIDFVDHADRLRILSEVRRVLRPGGAFVFSSHNRAATPAGPWRLPDLATWRAHPRHAALRLLGWPVGIANHWRRRRHERREADHALLNDGAHLFGLLTYYIRARDQVAQLHAAGFEAVRVLRLDGSEVDPAAPDAATAGDHWLTYACRRRPGDPPSGVRG